MAEQKEYYFCLFMESEGSFDSNLQFIENMREWWGHSVIYQDKTLFIEQIKQSTKKYLFVIHYLYGVKDLESHIIRTFINEVGLSHSSVEYFHHHIFKDKHALEKYLHKNSFRDYFSPIHQFKIK